MYTYEVEFTQDGATESQTVQYKAANVKSAFERCLRRFPHAKLIKGRVQRSYRENGKIYYSVTTYDPPSTVRIPAEPAPNEEQLAFGFLEKLSSHNATKPSGGATRRFPPRCLTTPHGETVK
jgi:hypothetical protein